MLACTLGSPVHEDLARVVPSADADEVRRLIAVADVDIARAFATAPELAAFVQGELRENMHAKAIAGVTLTVAAFERTVVDYEIFKAQIFLSSGVFPKRYFGYVDERWDTALRERELRDVIKRAVVVLKNASRSVRLAEAAFELAQV